VAGRKTGTTGEFLFGDGRRVLLAGGGYPSEGGKDLVTGAGPNKVHKKDTLQEKSSWRGRRWLQIEEMRRRGGSRRRKKRQKQVERVLQGGNEGLWRLKGVLELPP